MSFDRFNLGMPLLVFLLLALVIAGLGYFVFQQQAGSLKARAQSELAAIADLKADQIASWRDERYGDAQTTSQDYFFQSAVTQWIQAGSPSDDRRQRLVERLTTVQQVYDYQEVALLDGQGLLRLSSSGASPTVSPFTQGLAVQAMSTSTILFSDLYKAEEEAGQPIRIDLFAPLFDRDRHVAGVLLFRIDPRRFLFSLIQSWPVLRIPTKPAMHSNMKPATYSNPKPAGVPI